jgi:3-isopropylmalate/(R)-2-methylmalate dehydratase large subunit
MATARTLFEKIWQRHVIAQRSGQVLLYVDRQFLHDGSIHAFDELAARGLEVRRPQQTFGTPDHYVPIVSRSAADAPSAEIRFMV